MAIGSALGGWAAAFFGYKVAFVINAVSFLASAYSVWLVPESVTRDAATAERMEAKENREIVHDGTPRRSALHGKKPFCCNNHSHNECDLGDGRRRL